MNILFQPRVPMNNGKFVQVTTKEFIVHTQIVHTNPSLLHPYCSDPFLQ